VKAETIDIFEKLAMAAIISTAATLFVRNLWLQ
jgi:hypothetical protein